MPAMKPIRGKLLTEVLTMVHNASTLDDKKQILKAAETPALLHVLRHAFCPQIEFDVEVPEYFSSSVPPGLTYANLNGEARRLYIFTKDYTKITPYRKRELLLQILESIDESEARLLIQVINKDIKVKGLDASLVESTFPGLLAWKGQLWKPETSQNGSSQSNEQTQDKMSTLSKVTQNTLDQPKQEQKSMKSGAKPKVRSNSVTEIS